MVAHQHAISCSYPTALTLGSLHVGGTYCEPLKCSTEAQGIASSVSQELAPLDLGLPIIPGFNDIKFTIVRPAPIGQIAPSQRVPIDVIYRLPTTFSLDGAKLKLTYWDPYEMEDKIVEGDLSDSVVKAPSKSFLLAWILAW